MEKIVLIDGNSILNRAFYGIMGSKMLMTADGKYTNAVYGFLAILFKVLEDIKPEYLMIAFDLKAPTARHLKYEGYKANRKGMPNELAEQMPILKDILRAMNITIIEKEGYEADDVLGTISKRAEKEGLDVTIVSGDRDTFQLTSKNIKVRIPHTKVGKTEVDTFNEDDIKEKYGVTPKQLIEVKGLQGDTSDNIPGVPGVGEKTALKLIQEYETIENLYKKIENNEADLKTKLKENLINNRDLADLSRFLGEINLKVPIDEKVSDFKIKEWNKEEVLQKFKELNFNRFIERFELQEEQEVTKDIKELFEIKTINNDKEIEDIINKIKKDKKMYFYLDKKERENKNTNSKVNENSKTNANEEKTNDLYIIKKDIVGIYIFNDNFIYEIKNTNKNDGNNKDNYNLNKFKEIFENESIQKYGYHLVEDFVILKQNEINLEGITFDVKIAAYDINPTNNHYLVEELAMEYLNIDVMQYLKASGIEENKQVQINLFDSEENSDDESEFEKYKNGMYLYIIVKLVDKLGEKIKELNEENLFKAIEIPLIKVLADMQFAGIYADKNELTDFGENLKEQIERLRKEIYDLSGEEFNINSTQQLGNVLFEKLKLPIYKKTKRGYSTDVEILEKLKPEHPVIEKILEYRSLMKLNSTYVEGLLVYINNVTNKIHSYFHQTITATGRISSTEPNLQNIPTRIELGKQIRKVFKPKEGNIFIDADYSQIELRILAHISKDENMVAAFKNGEDIHRQVASKVFNVAFEEVTSEQRSAAKAVNFGIVYGISGFGLSEQLGISRKKADEYINQYLTKYSGVKEFMDNIVEKAKQEGYVETLFNRRRYIPELSSNNYMVRQFGSRAAMNTPIQGTAADIMKIAMIKVYDELKKNKLNANVILQIHDELLIECKEEEKEQVKEILKNSMENAYKLDIPLKVDMSEAYNWYDVK